MIAVTPSTLERFRGHLEWRPYTETYPEIVVSPGIDFLVHNGQDLLIDLICANLRRHQRIGSQIWRLRFNPNYHPDDPDTKKIRGLWRDEKEPFELTGEDTQGQQFARAVLMPCGINIEYFGNDFQVLVYRFEGLFGIYLPIEVEDE